MRGGSDADMETENQWASKLAINQPTQLWFCRLESRMEFLKEGFPRVEFTLNDTEGWWEGDTCANCRCLRKQLIEW